MTLEERYLDVKRRLFDKAYSSLNNMQKSAVFTVNDPLLVIAGAGSGKTTVLVRRIAFIIKFGNAYNSTYVPYGVDETHIENLEKALMGLDVKALNKKIFIEALACNGGCLAGPCSSTKKSEIQRVSDVLSNVKERDEIPVAPKVIVEEEYSAKKIEKPTYSSEKIVNALKKIGKHTQEDELNCGGCGYSTCREFVTAMLSEEAEPSMCISYMRKIGMRKAAAMLRCMPSAIVMVDSDLKIVESNEAFMRMFCGEMYEVFAERPEGVNGACPHPGRIWSGPGPFDWSSNLPDQNGYPPRPAAYPPGRSSDSHCGRPYSRRSAAPDLQNRSGSECACQSHSTPYFSTGDWP